MWWYFSQKQHLSVRIQINFVTKTNLGAAVCTGKVVSGFITFQFCIAGYFSHLFLGLHTAFFCFFYFVFYQISEFY